MSDYEMIQMQEDCEDFWQREANKIREIKLRCFDMFVKSQSGKKHSDFDKFLSFDNFDFINQPQEKGNLKIPFHSMLKTVNEENSDLSVFSDSSHASDNGLITE